MKDFTDLKPNTEFQVIITGDDVKFLHKGQLVDPMLVMQAASLLGCKVYPTFRVVPVTTELKAFGAPEDGVFTVLGYDRSQVTTEYVLLVWPQPDPKPVFTATATASWPPVIPVEEIQGEPQVDETETKDAKDQKQRRGPMTHRGQYIG